MNRPYFSVFYHRLKFWTLNFNFPQLLQKTFVPHGIPFNNIYLHVYYHPSKFVGLVPKYPAYVSYHPLTVIRLNIQCVKVVSLVSSFFLRALRIFCLSICIFFCLHLSIHVYRFTNLSIYLGNTVKHIDIAHK